MFKFKTINQNDLTLIYQWFQEPSINQWYARGKPWSLEAIKAEHNTVRPRFLSRLQSFVDVASKCEMLPHLREMAKDMLTTVKKQWPDVKYLEFYPAWSQKQSE